MHFLRILAYGVGHVFNDLCASIWFTYFLIFFHNVIRLDNVQTGYLMLLGQVADAIATIFVGLEVDKSKGFFGYSKKKSWHLLGTIGVALSFPFVYTRAIGNEYNTQDLALAIYYAPFIIMFQFGWATTQISHLALIPAITPDKNIKHRLNALRSWFTVGSNITVYVAIWILLKSDDEDRASAFVFKILALGTVGLGLLFSIIFHVGVKEIKNDQGENHMITNCDKVMKHTDWFKKVPFYVVAMLYMCTRLVVNLAQSYLPLYLQEGLQLGKEYLAVIPLVVYVSNFLTTFVSQWLNGRRMKFMLYFCGICCIIIASVWFYLIAKFQISAYYVFGPAVFLGIGCSFILVQSMSFLSDLIGNQTGSSGFVYGCMSFTDKMAGGVGVAIIQQLHPCPSIEQCCTKCIWYYTAVFCFVPGGCILVAFVFLVALYFTLPKSVKNVTVNECDADNGNVTKF